MIALVLDIHWCNIYQLSARERKHPKQAVFKKQKKFRANDFLSFF